ncbi:MAG: TetR/AcrR family transcriptional regulator [Clostridia bacterium]|nr:TetR/AcrR family transcriptional regulator [Clostridia bacterium]
MAVPDVSIDPRLLESAKRHFLDDGFEKASLRTICEDAGITTGALYKRYSGKDELFTAVVRETVDAIDTVSTPRSSVPVSELSDTDLIRAWNMDQEDMMWWMRFLNDHHDGFTLLLRCSQGSRWSNFNRDLVERMSGITWGYLEEAKRRGLSSRQIRREEMYILLSAFWQTIYEPFIQGFDWDRIEEHCLLICHLFNWNKVLGFEKD